MQGIWRWVWPSVSPYTALYSASRPLWDEAEAGGEIILVRVMGRKICSPVLGSGSVQQM